MMDAILDQPPSAGGVLVVGDRVVVLVKRLNSEVRLPKGRCDAGETAAQAALREVAEETGFGDLGLRRELGALTTEYTSGGRRLRRSATFFQMELRSWRRCARDVRDAHRFAVLWMPVGEALAALTFEDEREFLRRALET
jgi:8-oxo-dGTP pyrophosphatase MutT (NUDIX family)